MIIASDLANHSAPVKPASNATPTDRWSKPTGTIEEHLLDRSVWKGKKYPTSASGVRSKWTPRLGWHISTLLIVHSAQMYILTLTFSSSNKCLLLLNYLIATSTDLSDQPAVVCRLGLIHWASHWCMVPVISPKRTFCIWWQGIKSTALLISIITKA